MKVKVEDKVYLPNEKRPYIVQARDDRFIICTKPYNPKKTVMYFIVDLKRKVRGTDNLVFGYFDGYETRVNCEGALKSLQDGEMEVSYRNVVDLDIDIE